MQYPEAFNHNFCQTLRIRLMTANDDDESSWLSAMDTLEARSETCSMASARHPHTDQLDIADNNTIRKKKKQKNTKPKKHRSAKKLRCAQLQSRATRLLSQDRAAQDKEVQEDFQEATPQQPTIIATR